MRPSLRRLSAEEHPRRQQEHRHENRERPAEVREEARHPHAARLGDRLHHEIRRVADVAVRAHEHGARRDRRERRRPRRHQRLRIAAREIEEHEIGRRVVEERREHARRPEVHRVDRLAVGARDEMDDRREHAVAARAQNHDHGRDRHEDAREQLRDLLDRRPVERVALARRARRDRERHERDRDERDVAHRILQRDVRAEQIERDARLPEAAHQHERDHRTEQHEIDLALDRHAVRIGRRIEERLAFLAALSIEVGIEHEEEREQDRADEQHRQREMDRRPEEIDAVQKAEEERRIAERRQRAARVRHEKDEEHDDVHDVLAIVVRAQERTDQQHRGARGAHHAREHGAEREDARIEPGRAVQVAAHADTARDRIQRAQQHDERDVFLEQRVHQRAERGAEAERRGERHQERNRPRRRDLAEMVMPEHRRDQRKDRDRQQDAGERNRPERGKRGTVERCGRCERGRGA
ncbi:hypothetical protein BURPS1710b_2927 [Burkholderia pseudomallei 1710b]|uniref:Uncharacterized protein n=1 Tax=Burkholderia pseudomallei (strain 1710b) TaxID=320372 RepID=Q3JQ45_BURP1|nr:hypothetical protein BURPS1710b_2927 [Burkholderia pseudomallei 1710b]